MLLIQDVVKRYGTLTACNGLEALETYARGGDEIDLVLLDMAMPLLGGPECFRAMRKINPEVRAVLSTGYGFTSAMTQDVLADGMAGFIQKPYELSELSRVIATAMDKKKGSDPFTCRRWRRCWGRRGG